MLIASNPVVFSKHTYRKNILVVSYQASHNSICNAFTTADPERTIGFVC